MENKPVKILFVTVDTVGGGAERMMFNIIGTLRPSVDIRLLITSNQEVPNEAPNNFQPKSLHKAHANQALFDIIREVRAFKPNYVFTTSSSIGYMLVIAKYTMLKHRPKVLIRCAVPPSEIYFNSIRSKILRHLIRLTYKGADQIIAQTEYMRKDLMQSYNLSSDKVLHIRNIIDDNFLDHKATEYIPKEYKKHNFNIVAAGALYSVKGFDILIKSFAKLSVVNSAANLYIIGKERYEKGYREILESLISELNLMGKVHLLGHKNNPYPYIKNANLLVMSSRKEGFPNVVLEALHFCTPVIATDCVDWDGIIVNGINGYVVPREDIHALSDGLIKAINNEFKTSEIELSNFDYNVLFK